MTDADERLIVVFNGEIYNYVALRDELRPEAAFRTATDTEVLLHGYRRWGIEGLLERLDGMFAFALYDRDRREMLLARDHAGIKPLYWAADGRRLVFASELKAIRGFADAAGPVDAEALYDYFVYRYVPAPKTIWRGVSKLPPGAWARIPLDGGAPATRTWWRPDYRPRDMGFDEAAADVADALAASVRAQLTGDRPIGVFLSGGVDSTAIAAALRGVAGSGFPAFSVDFVTDRASEARAAADTAARLGLAHHVVVVDDAAVMAGYPALASWFDEPFANLSALPTHALCAETVRHVAVALSGDGGDELFGGYPRILSQGPMAGPRPAWARALRSALGFALPRMRRGELGRLRSALTRRAFADDLEAYAWRFDGEVREDRRVLRQALGVPEDYDDLWFFRAHDDPSLPTATRFQMLDLRTYLPEEGLTKVDRASMRCGLEVRVPMLSRRMMETALTIPEAVRLRGGALKALLKTVAFDLLPRRAVGAPLPAEAWTRPKQGFGVGRPPVGSPISRRGKETVQRPLYRAVFQRGLGLPELPA
jgi:asparagine synthase (glutamine-hydrolysing)